MYSNRKSSKDSIKLADIRVGSDKGNLRLQFSTRISQQFYRKRQAYKGLGRTDTPENLKWANQLAARIQADIDHPDGGCFDPTLAKYLTIKQLTTISQLQNLIKPPLLGELWHEFVDWKLQTKQIQKSTYKKNFVVYTNLIKDFLDAELNLDAANNLIEQLSAKQSNQQQIKKLFSLLSNMCQRAISNQQLTQDYFFEIKKAYNISKKPQKIANVEDYRAYSLEERDLIIQAFRNSEQPSIKHGADLIEFLFLTGCRHSEVFALKWRNIKLNEGWIVFKEAFDSRTGMTKSNKNRLFKMQGMSRLINLLIKLYSNGKRDNELVFETISGKQYSSNTLTDIWAGNTVEVNGKVYHYPGVVKKLAEDKQLEYLKPYSTRHTFISIQANNGADLKLLANSCGNSVEQIIKHYLQFDNHATLKDI
ncbi:tyrosine-type recombinase/integrase [Tolypothrix sp. PCC 7910]|uniref:tyrosine-type recombinase/integrase n=1 Tax=Tolypothrix sp. PCC 7910 TaxID=2099387 RepID=UPI00142795E9|nr:tyrosine-type recombinase/integrase [Tolypothrix sp. PCC 7910]QIR40944.1 tyrosine-type recombinase/integrase [Tolypothrix sp. PCC 7910]